MAEAATGFILLKDGSPYEGDGDIWWVMDSLDEAKDFITDQLKTNDSREFVVFDHQGAPVWAENREGRQVVDAGKEQ